MMELRLKDVVIRCGHPQANEAIAQSIATVFNQYSLEGNPDNAPIGVSVMMDDG